MSSQTFPSDPAGGEPAGGRADGDPVILVLRVWLPDRPGALGAVASRIGSVGGDLVGIEVLERGGGRAIDELVVELPELALVDLMLNEVAQVDGADVEEWRRLSDSPGDPRLDALETAAILVGASSPAEVLDALCVHAARTIGATWAAVIDREEGRRVAMAGDPPGEAWLSAFVEGSGASARLTGAESAETDVVWAPMVSAGLALVLGRELIPYRARERRQVAALARIADARFRELTILGGRLLHPSHGR